MIRSTLIDMRSRLSRTRAIVVAVVLGVAFVTASLLSGSVMEHVVRGSVGNQLRGSDIVVFKEFGSLQPDLGQELQAIDGVGATEDIPVEYGQATIGGGTVMLGLGPLPQLPELVAEMPLAEGRVPEQPDEIMLTEAARSRSGSGIGDTISWSSFDDLDASTDPALFKVVGIVRGGNSFGTNLIEAFAVPDRFSEVASHQQLSVIVVQVEDGRDIDTVLQDVAHAVPDGVGALTYGQLVDAEVKRMQEGSNVLLVGLVGFASIAMFAASIVVSNTFSISVAQRTRDLAMLRCLGADHRQVRRSLFFEAILLGGVASLLGVALGIGIIAAGMAMFIDTGSLDSVLSSPWRLVLPILAGTAVTLGAAIVPARAATRVHPLQALRQSDASVESGRPGMLRGISAAVTVLGGGAIMIMAMLWSLSLDDESPLMPLLAGMFGGGMSFLGLLLGTSVVLPPMVAAAGSLVASVVGMPAKIASANTRRNPRRTASTAMALMLGVTLIAMMTTGANSVQETWNDVIDERAPVDLTVVQDDDSATALPDHIRSMAANTDGAGSTVPVRSQRGEVAAGDSGSLGVSVVGVDPDAGAEVVRSNMHDELSPGTVLVGDLVAFDLDIEGGEILTVTVGGQSIDLTASVVKFTDYSVFLTPQDLEAIAPDAPVTGLWMRLDDDASARQVVRDIADNIPDGDHVTIGGSASERATFMELVDQILMVVTALLGVAVVIAVVGVGNTLNLSVLERTRETGMLRAMGLTTSQVSVSLAIEGALIAAIGGIVGIAVGAIYGWVGTTTMFGSTWSVSFGFPLGRLALILAIAILAGVLASVLPARRANSVTPVEALATI